ncbi:type IX secretion system membrane protein PorP/SprF [Pedobacter xixiisoli]|uniref:Type IX secretion system membrane protein, PorP/SprF family n=1 Tax=Pedobacter xixiisoli TaxID=1476464 RepID=A0A285ZVV2_9SPHI|nr:type IX secretion system membrane protein PorP/SprF [Pedobacter xixiisoli]SOD13756.1 type IX secretion system membrane protein, PorP/SprF family [Pedobacter xixiisoli]
MKRYFILIFIASLLVGKANAQQEAMYSQYMFNTLAINPAYAGSRNVTSATALYRSQWVGIDGAPETLTFTIDAPLNNKKVGLGLQVFSDKIGVTQNTGALASYAYRIRMETGTLSFGLQAGYSQFRGAFSTVPLNSSGVNNDLEFQDLIHKGLLNIGTGVYYNSDRFYVGLSAPQLLNNQLNGFSASNEVAYAGQRLHLFLASGYVFPLSQDFDLKPSVLVKGVKGAPIQADLNANLWIKQTFSIGVQYRTNADIAAMFEVQASPQLRLGYSYDRSTTKLVQFNSGSHEIMLRYEFGFERGRTISPRYF